MSKIQNEEESRCSTRSLNTMKTKTKTKTTKKLPYRKYQDGGGGSHRRSSSSSSSSSSSGVISFSAKLPDDVAGGGALRDCMCAVKYSTNPFSDFRESIIEVMMENMYDGDGDWDQMEELIYCYIALNSPQLHPFIQHAFLTLSFTSPSSSSSL